MASMLGEVDLLGLDAFGNNPGMDTLYGTAIGAGVTTLVKQIAKPENAGKWGFVAGAVTTAGLYLAGTKTRHASLGAALGTAISSGLFDGLLARILGVFGMGNTAGVGLPQIVDIGPASALRGAFGLPEVGNLAPVYGTGNLGLPGINQVPPAYGVWNAMTPIPSGIAGPQLGQAPPVDLLGQPTAQSQQLELMGGPTISGLSAHYGATLLGGLQ